MAVAPPIDLLEIATDRLSAAQRALEEAIKIQRSVETYETVHGAMYRGGLMREIDLAVGDVISVQRLGALCS